MRLLTIYSYEKQYSLGKVFDDQSKLTIENKFWTSGTDLNCQGKFRWCSNEIKDYIKTNLLWQKGQPGMNNSCIYIQNDNLRGPLLGTNDCKVELHFICESRTPANTYFESVVNECQEVNRVSNHEVLSFKNESINKFSYRMKCFIACIFEIMALFYDNHKFWIDTVIQYISGTSIDTSNELKLKEKISKAIFNLTDESKTLDETKKFMSWLGFYTHTFEEYQYLTKREALENFAKCQNIQKRGEECVYAYEFYSCLFNNSQFLQDIWKFDGIVVQNIDNYLLWGYKKGELMSQKPTDIFPISSELLSLKCFFKDLKENDERDARSYCSALLYYNTFITNDTRSFTFFLPWINNKRFPLENGFKKCHQVRGTPLIAASVEEFNKTFIFLNGTKNNLLWNEAYVDENGKLWWCGFESLKVPVPLDSGTDIIADFPFYLVSLASPRPNLHAIYLDSNISIPQLFCQIPKSVANKCLKYPQYFTNYTYYELPLPEDIYD
ncbi:uncharacterized protein LOC132197870 [Neocloeon triangulifer]|uniref:uncharacterized protein LOC132197870 n=1 Tax=Neocloeon triangulifer TaxID=2078957 RepID=UPI00286F5820|nr:uncharacterized protein LOC132197870 [Neocloeon triangulifer]